MEILMEILNAAIGRYINVLTIFGKNSEELHTISRTMLYKGYLNKWLQN
jgi:hypothetical protein